MFFDLSQIFTQYKKHFDLKFLKFWKESDNFLLNKIFGQSHDVGVHFSTSVSASVEVYREVGGDLSWTVIFRGDPNRSIKSLKSDLQAL